MDRSELRRNRAYLLDLTMLWLRDQHIEGGNYPITLLDFYELFAEWLEDTNPGWRERFEAVFPPKMWEDMLASDCHWLHRKSNRYKSRKRYRSKFRFFLNQNLEPREKLIETRQVCQHCAGQGYFYTFKKQPNGVSREELVAQYESASHQGITGLPSIEQLKDEVEASGILHDVDLDEVFKHSRKWRGRWRPLKKLVP